MQETPWTGEVAMSKDPDNGLELRPEIKKRLVKSKNLDDERKRFKKALIELTSAGIIFDKKMEKIMKLPSNYERGRKIAEAMNDLIIANQCALHFALEYSFKKIKKMYSTN
jgi:hypothetical protein